MAIAYQVIKRTSNQIELAITVPKDLVEQRFKQVYQELAPHVQVKGFRPGHAPRSMTIERIGIGRLMEETLNRLLRQAYQETITIEKLLPVGQPDIQVKKWGIAADGTVEHELEFSCQTELMPLVEIGDYTNLTLPKSFFLEPEPVLEKDIEGVIGHLQRQKATPKPVEKDQVIKHGDLAIISYEGKVGGVSVEQLKNTHYPVTIGSGTLIAEFEQHLIGVKQGQKLSFTITLPKEINHRPPAGGLAGKLASFEVTIDEVKELDLPALDDTLAATFGVKDLEALKRQVKESLEQERAQAKRAAIEQAALDQALTLLKIDVPNALIEEEIERMVKRLSKEASNRGLPFPIYLEKIGKTEATIRQEFRPNAEKNVRFGLLIGEVIKREKLDIKDEQAPRKAVERLVEIAKGNSFAKSKAQMSNAKSSPKS